MSKMRKNNKTNKIRRKTAAVILAALLLTGLTGGMAVQANEAEKSEKKIDVMFTHDTHSRLDSYMAVVDGKELMTGGFARIQTLMKEQKAQNPDTLVLDAGDFSMGSLVQTVFASEAPELRMLGALGYDVSTLGNHEFDYRSAGLADMLKAAAGSGDRLPAMVLSNVDWEAMEEAGLTEAQQLLRDSFQEYGIKDYVVLNKGDVDIAVFGIFGEDALACAPTCVLKFKDPVSAAKETVAEIKAKEDVDMIVCVSHSGTSADKDKSEDEKIAKAAPDIDLIISGHTHTELGGPIQHGNTYIVSCGEYGRKVGAFSMRQEAGGRWHIEDYRLITVDENIEADREAQEKINGFMENVDSTYLSRFGYTKDQTLAENNVEFCSEEDLENLHQELNLGNIMADAYVYAVEQKSDLAGETVDIAVVPSGTVRDTYGKGAVTVEDVFHSFSLGIGADGVPGYPLVSAYLSGKELKNLAEIDASVSDYMTVARLYTSGMHFTYNPHRLILNKVTDCYLTDKEGNRREIEDDKLYRIVTDLYSGQMLGAVTDMSFGLLSIVPKNADGTPIEDLESAIIMTEGRELKGWEAIAAYMESFEDTDGNGIANVPEYYAAEQGRKVVDDSKNIISLIKNPNRFAAMIAGAVVCVILMAVGGVLLVRKLFKVVSGRRK